MISNAIGNVVPSIVIVSVIYVVQFSSGLPSDIHSNELEVNTLQPFNLIASVLIDLKIDYRFNWEIRHITRKSRGARGKKCWTWNWLERIEAPTRRRRNFSLYTRAGNSSLKEANFQHNIVTTFQGGLFLSQQEEQWFLCKRRTAIQSLFSTIFLPRLERLR